MRHHGCHVSYVKLTTRAECRGTLRSRGSLCSCIWPYSASPCRALTQRAKADEIYKLAGLETNRNYYSDGQQGESEKVCYPRLPQRPGEMVSVTYRGETAIPTVFSRIHVTYALLPVVDHSYRAA